MCNVFCALNDDFSFVVLCVENKGNFKALERLPKVHMNFFRFFKSMKIKSAENESEKEPGRENLRV